MTPAISVILPAYNRAASIVSAAESVLRQTWSDFELIIVDDCSTDDTVPNARTIKDSRVKLLSTPKNGGPSAARNVGLAAATGEWVAFQDSDDEWLPEKLSQQMARLAERAHIDIAAYCGMAIVGSPENAGETSTDRAQVRYHPGPEATTVEGNISEALLARSLISTQTLMAKRDALQQIGGFDEDLPALVDWECVLRLSDLGSFAFVDRPLVVQNFSLNSVTRDRWRRAEARQTIMEKHATRFAPHPDLHARHWRAVAGDARRLGKISEAKRALNQAIALRPFDPKLRALSLWLATKG